MLNKKIEKITSQILKDNEVNSLPIPINELAWKRGLAVQPYDLGENVSGVLVINNGTGFIGYNPLESSVRQRFTVAHELGHYELHRPNQQEALFVDNTFRVEFRNQDSSTGELAQEREANAFAAAILMPENILLEVIKNYHFELGDDESIQKLSTLFNVSVSAMTFRLINLKLL
jgi:Zn-dependent peptidase ImmA (M78 family)